MFGFFKKKLTPKSAASPSLEMDLRSAVAPLLNIYESFSSDITESYSGLDHNPAELRFFTMAATSVFIQSYGELPQEKMQTLVGMFYEQGVANMLLYMPRAEFSLVHTVATQRFGPYTSLIIDVINAQTGEALQDANLSLLTVLDENLKVERGAFERSVAGLTIGSGLVDYAVQVKDAVGSVRGTF